MDPYSQGLKFRYGIYQSFKVSCQMTCDIRKFRVAVSLEYDHTKNCSILHLWLKGHPRLFKNKQIGSNFWHNNIALERI